VGTLTVLCPFLAEFWKMEPHGPSIQAVGRRKIILYGILGSFEEAELDQRKFHVKISLGKNLLWTVEASKQATNFPLAPIPENHSRS
jgi:hypothetical protein